MYVGFISFSVFNFDLFLADLTKYSNVIKSIKLNVVDNTNCEQRINKEFGISNFRVHETQICVGGETGKDTCKVGLKSYNKKNN